MLTRQFPGEGKLQHTEDLRFAVLGPLEVWHGQCPVPVRGSREHVVLATLLVADDGVVSMDRLVEAVWEENPPYAAVKAVRNCVSALRRRLIGPGGPAVPIETTAAGYRLRLADCGLDAREFRQQASAGRRLAAAGHTARAATMLRAALGLWRGPALTGITARTVQASAARMDEERMTALEECLDLELALGQHRRAVSELRHLAGEFPLRERFTAQLMLALYRSSRQAEALSAYHQLADRLAGDLGIDPGGEITRLHMAILRQESCLDLGHRTVPTATNQPPAAGRQHLHPARRAS